MENEINIKRPWQAGPSELISYALDHYQKKDDFNNRIAFLLIDIGIETLFKVYLSLDSDITGSLTSHTKRNTARNGSFYDLINGIKESAGGICMEQLNSVKYYHQIRNKLYHESDGITISEDKVEHYAKVAVHLLKFLLDVDLSSKLHNQEAVQLLKNYYEEYRSLQMNLSEEMHIFMELLEPNLCKVSFKRGMRKARDSNLTVSLWNVCRLIENTLNVDLDNHFSDEDKESVNQDLLSKGEPSLDNYRSLKHIMYRVMGTWEDGTFCDLVDLPIGNYIINGLIYQDFLNGRDRLFSIIITEIIEVDFKYFVGAHSNRIRCFEEANFYKGFEEAISEIEDIKSDLATLKERLSLLQQWNG